MNRKIIRLTLRLVLGLNFVFAAIANLQLLKFYVEDQDKITSWITDIHFIGTVISVGLLLTGTLLILGIKTFEAAVLSVGFILLNHLSLLLVSPYKSPFSGPFYNTFHHSVPFIGFLMLLLFALPENRFSFGNWFKIKSNEVVVDKNEFLFLLSRIFVGAIFLAQGINIFLRPGSFIEFARKWYVTGYSSIPVPEFLLWTMGILNPFTLTICGAFFLLGLWIRQTAYVASFFMISIVFGHLLGDPFETSGDISMYGFNNLAFVLIILWQENGNNKIMPGQVIS